MPKTIVTCGTTYLSNMEVLIISMIVCFTIEYRIKIMDKQWREKEMYYKEIKTEDLNDIQGVSVEYCWHCENEIEEYCFSPKAYCKDGSCYIIEDIITGMSKQDMIDYENNIKKENDNVDYVEFGEFCPHCLACIS